MSHVASKSHFLFRWTNYIKKRTLYKPKLQLECARCTVYGVLCTVHVHFWTISWFFFKQTVTIFIQFDGKQCSVLKVRCLWMFERQGKRKMYIHNSFQLFRIKLASGFAKRNKWVSALELWIFIYLNINFIECLKGFAERFIAKHEYIYPK